MPYALRTPMHNPCHHIHVTTSMSPHPCHPVHVTTISVLYIIHSVIIDERFFDLSYNCNTLQICQTPGQGQMLHDL